MASGTSNVIDSNPAEIKPPSDVPIVYTRRKKRARNSNYESATASTAEASNGVPEDSLQAPAAKDVGPLSEQPMQGQETVAPVDHLKDNPLHESGGGGEETAASNGVVATAGEKVTDIVKPVISRVEDRVRIDLSGLRSGEDNRELREMLEDEVNRVRSVVKKLEDKEVQMTAFSSINNVNNAVAGSFGEVDGGSFSGYGQRDYTVSQVMEKGSLNSLRVMNPRMRPVGVQQIRPLTVSVVSNNHGVGEFVEREKRTPKANQYYRNSEFLLGKDRLPPENKKSKLNGGRKHGSDGRRGFGFGHDKHMKQLFKSCNSLLQRLMKHKHGWVFNEPVDARALGLHDYHDIIEHPMDLGTIKTRLSQNWYKNPREFAEDVRLVFRNAMTYNPKGQDVHIMAEELSKIFEERWAVIETDYNPNWRYQMYYDAGLPTPASSRGPPPSMFANYPASQMRSLDRSKSMPNPLRSSNFAHVGRSPAPKKPKADDPNKRDMTYKEKQRLSTNLQSLPSEKLDAIVQIIKKRNSAVSQHEDEIEVDIDSVDAETLWELDRLVTNYKKNLSKHKRRAERAQQARKEAAQADPVVNPTPAVADIEQEIRTVEQNAPSSPPPPIIQNEKQEGANASRPSSSSSSSSDSDSSSSDSDSDSSSSSESDTGHSPET